MSLRRLIIRLRVLFTIVVVLSVVSLVAGLSYLHEKGFSDDAADRVAEEMERYGIYAEFDNLSLHVIRGLTANNVRFYQSKRHEIQIAELPALAIHVDKTKLMRGKLKINTIAISGARLTVPLVTNIENSPVIDISDVSGSIDLSGNQSLKTSNLTGSYQGIKVALSCNIWRDNKQQQERDFEIDSATKIKRYNIFLQQLQNWSWPAATPPKLQLIVEGNLSNPSKVDINVDLRAPALQLKNYQFDEVFIEGNLYQNLITLDRVEFKNQTHPFTATTDYDILQKNGRFIVDSSIDLQRFARRVFDKRILRSFSAAGRTQIKATGQYQLPLSDEKKLDLSMVGSVESNDFSFRGASINHLTSDFSWNNGDLYLDNLAVDHALGKLDGRFLIKDRLIRFEANTSLPAKVFFPFIKSKQLVKSLSGLSFDKDSTIQVLSKGSINQDNPKEWSAHGHADFENFSYNGVPAKFLKTDYSLDKVSAAFFNTRGTFDYSAYPLREEFDGPTSGSFSAKEISFDWKEKYADITELRGGIWPAPVLRMFAPKIADHLQVYRFHRPPSVSAAGRISWNPGDANDTRFLVGFTSSGNTTYNFIKKDVRFSKIKGQVTVLHNKVQVNSLSAQVFGGNISGHIRVTPSNSAYNGRFQWDQLRLSSLSKAYGFKGVDSGMLTGSFKFRGKGSKVSTLNGHGNLALANGDLFAVPLFGPLSSLINSALNPAAKQKLLHDQAKDFSCNFSTKNGKFHTKDLTSATPNTTFTGEGWIDLNKETLDLTIRMNFRGLMGLAEVPMKVIELPFQALKKVFTGQNVKGLRQFHGTGKISNPNWKFSPFEAPRDPKNDPIFRTPPRARIVR